MVHGTLYFSNVLLTLTVMEMPVYAKNVPLFQQPNSYSKIANVISATSTK